MTLNIYVNRRSQFDQANNFFGIALDRLELIGGVIAKLCDAIMFGTPALALLDGKTPFSRMRPTVSESLSR